MTDRYQVTVYHNEGPDRFHCYRPSTALLKRIGAYDFEDPEHSDLYQIVEEGVADAAWKLFNHAHPETDHRTMHYRGIKRARSLSVGDVLEIRHENNSLVYLSCETTGWKRWSDLQPAGGMFDATSDAHADHRRVADMAAAMLPDLPPGRREWMQRVIATIREDR